MKQHVMDSSAGHRQRLRDRFLQHGLDGFQDYEIIELLLSIGTPRKDCKQAAKAAIRQFGSLKNVLEAPSAELQKISGIGPNNVFGLKIPQAVARRYLEEKINQQPFIASSVDVVNYLVHHLRDRTREVFLLIYLNGRNQVITQEKLFEGSLTASAVYPREVVKAVLHHGAAAVVLVHNHPSGNPKPSRDDETITKRIQSALKAIDVTVHDHLIVAGNKITSFADEELL